MEKSVAGGNQKLESLKDAYGAVKQDSIVDVNVRTNAKGNMNQAEVAEAVSHDYISFFRKRGKSPNNLSGKCR